MIKKSSTYQWMYSEARAYCGHCKHNACGHSSHVTCVEQAGRGNGYRSSSKEVQEHVPNVDVELLG